LVAVLYIIPNRHDVVICFVVVDVCIGLSITVIVVCTPLHLVSVDRTVEVTVEVTGGAVDVIIEVVVTVTVDVVVATVEGAAPVEAGIFPTTSKANSAISMKGSPLLFDNIP